MSVRQAVRKRKSETGGKTECERGRERPGSPPNQLKWKLSLWSVCMRVGVTHALPGVFRGREGSVPSCVEVSLAANRRWAVRPPPYSHTESIYDSVVIRTFPFLRTHIVSDFVFCFFLNMAINAKNIDVSLNVISSVRDDIVLAMVGG